MKGFFFDLETKAERKEKTSAEKPLRSARLISKPKGKGLSKIEGDPCVACGLFSQVNSPKLGITGSGLRKILYMGEAQGANEDLAGQQFVGDAGQHLRETMTRLKLDFERDFWVINAVRCFTFDVSDKTNKRISRTPTDQEVALCHDQTWEIIKQLRPQAIWLSGLTALQSYLLGKSQTKPAMNVWRGWAIPDQELGCWVIPQYHPSFPMRNPKDVGLANLFTRDIKKALQKSVRPFRVYSPMEHLTLIYNEEDAVSLLNRVLQEKPEFLEIDFETTGLKPHRPGHDIKYAAICYGAPAHSYAFSTVNPKIRYLLGEILAHPDIGLGAHNIQFEDLWSRIILKTQPKNWCWDSQIAAHVLDDRRDITSLEFQAAVRYGDWYFKDFTNPYLKPPGKVEDRKSGANDFNRVMECPVDEILLRVAKDALYGYWLSFDQMTEMQAVPRPMKRGNQLTDAYWLFHDGTLALGETGIDGGLIFDTNYFDNVRLMLSKDMECTDKLIKETDSAKLWKERTGKDINYGSDTQLRKLLFDFHGIQATKKTGKDNNAVDNEVLMTLTQHPVVGKFVTMALDSRRKEKLRSTYIDGFAREAWQGIIYPHFGLNIPRSYRSSSNNPNFQNIPVRDEWAMHTIRMGLMPHPGHQFMGVDFGSHEVRIAACYSLDKELIRYCSDPTTDMHRDQACYIFKLPQELVPKKLRNTVKGDFVFAQLYGSWFRQCAESLWNNTLELSLDDGTPVHEHLQLKGIRSYEQFESHVEAEEHRFWRKFYGLDAWRKEWLARYDREGIVPMFHGFRRQGHLSRNKIFNTSIQGTAFHLLLWSFIKLNDIRKEEGWKSKLIGQIHDEIRWSVDPDEIDHLKEIHVWVMTEAIKEPHPWLCVPLEVEFKATEIDCPWATEEEIALAK